MPLKGCAYVAEAGGIRPGGGYIVTVAGRNLGFLDIDCDIMFGDKMGVKPTVTDAGQDRSHSATLWYLWEGRVYASCNGLKSNKKGFHVCERVLWSTCRRWIFNEDSRVVFRQGKLHDMHGFSSLDNG